MRKSEIVRRRDDLKPPLHSIALVTIYLLICFSENLQREQPQNLFILVLYVGGVVLNYYFFDFIVTLLMLQVATETAFIASFIRSVSQWKNL